MGQPKFIGDVVHESRDVPMPAEVCPARTGALAQDQGRNRQQVGRSRSAFRWEIVLSTEVGEVGGHASTTPVLDLFHPAERFEVLQSP